MRYAFLLCVQAPFYLRSSTDTCSVFLNSKLFWSFCQVILVFVVFRETFFWFTYVSICVLCLETESGEHSDVNEKLKHVKSSISRTPVKINETIVSSIPASKHSDTGTSNSKLPLQPVVENSLSLVHKGLHGALGSFVWLFLHVPFYFSLFVFFPGFNSGFTSVYLFLCVFQQQPQNVRLLNLLNTAMQKVNLFLFFFGS